MLSKLKIDLDTDNHPIIQVDYRESDDVRDKMIKRFIEGFGEASFLAKIIFTPTKDSSVISFKLRPIPSTELKQTQETLETLF